MEMATLWRTVTAKPSPIPEATTTTLWKTITKATITGENPPHYQRHNQKLQKCSSLRAATSFTRVCLCVPMSSYNEVFRSEIQPPRRSNGYARSRSISSGSVQERTFGPPRRSVEGMRRAVFRGKSLTEDVLMRRFVVEEEAALVQARRRDQMEAIRRRSLARSKKVGPSRLSRMVMAGD